MQAGELKDGHPASGKEAGRLILQLAEHREEYFTDNEKVS